MTHPGSSISARRVRPLTLALCLLLASCSHPAQRSTVKVSSAPSATASRTASPLPEKYAALCSSSALDDNGGTYYLAAWTGPTPVDGGSACREFARRKEAQDTHKQRPSAAMRSLVARLTKRYPDLTKDDNAIWEDGPLLDDASGDFLYVGISSEAPLSAVLGVLTILLSAHVVCYDPQQGELCTPR